MREIWLLFSGPVAPRLAGKSAANANETKQSKQLQSARTKLIETEHYTQPCLVKAVTLPVFFCFFFILFLSVTAEVFFERALLREQWQSDVCSAESLMELKFCFFCGRHQSFVASDLLLSLVLRSSNSGVCVGICHLAKTWKVHVYFERARVCMLRLTSHQVGGSGTKNVGSWKWYSTINSPETLTQHSIKKIWSHLKQKHTKCSFVVITSLKTHKNIYRSADFTRIVQWDGCGSVAL